MLFNQSHRLNDVIGIRMTMLACIISADIQSVPTLCYTPCLT